MRNTIGSPVGTASRYRMRQRRLSLTRIVVPATCIALAALAGLSAWDLLSPASPQRSPTSTPAPVRVAVAGRYDPLLDPRFSLGLAPRPLGHMSPLDGSFRSASPLPEAAAKPSAQPEEPKSAPSQPQLPDSPRLVQGTPLPIPRPADLQAPATPERQRVAAPPITRRVKSAAIPAIPEDNRSFFEKFFGVQRPAPGTALAYAAPQDDVVDAGRGRRLSPTPPPALASAQGTAVYDISARVVHMPNGEKLEAHSGLGDRLDDPRYAHERMRGVTPPHVYTLTEREQLFHGVRALRLNPVGGSAAIHGRAGLLAHTYLLGPNGDSNGCVSFKDYDKFLQAYLRGEIRRLVVVASMT